MHGAKKKILIFFFQKLFGSHWHHEAFFNLKKGSSKKSSFNVVLRNAKIKSMFIWMHGAKNNLKKKKHFEYIIHVPAVKIVDLKEDKLEISGVK